MKMKKIAALLFGMIMLACLAGCSGTRPSSEDDNATASATYTSALEILDNIFASYDEDQKFPITGGDSENVSMGRPRRV